MRASENIEATSVLPTQSKVSHKKHRASLKTPPMKVISCEKRKEAKGKPNLCSASKLHNDRIEIYIQGGILSSGSASAL